MIRAIILLLTLILSEITAARPANEMLAVVDENSSQVDFYNAMNGKFYGGVKVGTMPHEIVISKDKKTAYVTNFGLQDYDEPVGKPGASISVIDIPNYLEKYRLYTAFSSLTFHTFMKENNTLVS